MTDDTLCQRAHSATQDLSSQVLSTAAGQRAGGACATSWHSCLAQQPVHTPTGNWSPARDERVSPSLGRLGPQQLVAAPQASWPPFLLCRTGSHWLWPLGSNRFCRSLISGRGRELANRFAAALSGLFSRLRALVLAAFNCFVTDAPVPWPEPCDGFDGHLPEPPFRPPYPAACGLERGQTRCLPEVIGLMMSSITLGPRLVLAAAFLLRFQRQAELVSPYMVGGLKSLGRDERSFELVQLGHGLGALDTQVYSPPSSRLTRSGPERSVDLLLWSIGETYPRCAKQLLTTSSRFPWPRGDAGVGCPAQTQAT
ncbi:hypothetical protein DPEC_G00069370 [Dallia pectoralis]|uniref:Uncharacterized protein n=1 Tax=Dallia pectoralis TaxID=75939 RepID=A0ACC2H264_DALPE|nr:hypothetical protein DPEC_G00069370 [Dallia pectoralis]